MTQSMTGYGKAVGEFSDKNIIVEIKTLNSKQLDINSRINHVYREKEIEIRNILNQYLVRGKIDISVFYDYKDIAGGRIINKAIVHSYIRQLQDIATEQNLSESALLDIAMRQPDIYTADQTNELSEDEWHILQAIIVQACEDIIQYRKKEGEAMRKDVCANIHTIQETLQEIELIEHVRIEKIRERIRNYLQEYVSHEKIDNDRLEQEMIYYIEKLDINEEKTRLKQHCSFFLETIEQDATGKKLGFIAQEIGREINTIGSKANDADMQKMVVQMKDNLERIKEQTLNIL
ncbi:MAG: YicC/YloC family endoribonuclease [Bacteroidales bacterium]